MAATAEKQKKEQKNCKVLEKWSKKKYAGIISKRHPKNTLYSLFYLICYTSNAVKHQSKGWLRQTLHLEKTDRFFKK